MMIGGRCAAAWAAAFAVVTALESAASADDRRKEAQALFKQAVDQAQAGDTKGALQSFRAAYERAPSYKVLYNIGQLCAKTGDAVCAVRSYEQYLREGGGNVPAPRRQLVESEMKSLGKTLGALRLQSNVVDADVTIDDAATGRTPMPAPIVVAAGSHKIVLLYRDKTIEKNATVAPGETANVVLDVPKEEPPPAVLAPLPAPPIAAADPPKASPPPPPPSTPPSDEATSRHVPIAPWAVTGGLALTTFVTAVFAANAYASYKDKQNEFPISHDDLTSSQGNARTLFLVTSVFGGATLIAGGIAGYVTFFSPRANDASRAPLRVGVGPSGIALAAGWP